MNATNTVGLTLNGNVQVTCIVMNVAGSSIKDSGNVFTSLSKAFGIPNNTSMATKISDIER